MSKEKETKNTSKKNTNKEIKNKETKAKKEKELKKEQEIIESLDNEYDEDLEIIEEEEEIKIELVENKTKQENTTKKKEKKPIETKKKKDSNDFFMFFEQNHQIIYGLIAGILITTLIAFIIWPDRIAELKNGEEAIVKVGKKNYTADYLYKVMKDNYSVSLLLNEIDSDLLTKIYPENDEMKKEIESNANYYYDTYEQYYGYTKEQFLSQNGFANQEEFMEYLRLDYRRNKYLEDYITKNLSDKEIEEYYEENVFGDINTQHILVEFSENEEDKDKMSEEEAKNLADKIITKLNDGTSWEDIKKKYKDKITFEDLGYQSWDASLEESFMEALTDMDDNSYSEEPVKTSYGYHVIYRLDQKKAPKLKKVKDTIIENLITEKKAEDANLLYKALIKLRKEKNITFSDTDMKEKYEKYCKEYK